MDELYKQYGRLMIELEILQSRISAVKQQIANGINQGQEQFANNGTPKEDVGDDTSILS